jgi:hypothetical protein
VKLRLPTETTLEHLKNTTSTLGKILRKFVQITCNAFVTKELPCELAARTRRRATANAKKKTGKATASVDTRIQNTKKTTSSGRKLFNLCTYKLHALADYANSIRRYGTSDSYSTQVVRDVFLFPAVTES